MELLPYFCRVVRASQDHQGEGFAKAMLDCLVVATDAECGFVVVKEGDGFVEKVQLRFDRRGMAQGQRRLSRSLIRETLRSGESIMTDNLTSDPRFSRIESTKGLAPSPILTVPLGKGPDLFGAVYLQKKPFSTPFSREKVSNALEFCGLVGERVRDSLRLKDLETRYLNHGSALQLDGFVGRDPKMLELYETISQVAPTDATVLIRGETGTGKELVARALVTNSQRRLQPFVTIHCGALPESLFESELFGYQRGAFTGAQQDRPGRISQADGGTLFIDEIAEIPLAVQAKLLRFLQFGEYQRIGSDQVQQINVRIISATHRDLKEMVANGSFRQDLYYRLNVLEISAPALRERRSDIRLLVRHFLELHGRPADLDSIEPEALDALEGYEFPGNVRELDHAIERMCVLSKSRALEFRWLPKDIQDHYRSNHFESTSFAFSEYNNHELNRARKQAIKQATVRVEQDFLQGLIAMHGSNVAACAQKSGIHRTYLYRLLNKHHKPVTALKESS